MISWLSNAYGDLIAWFKAILQAIFDFFRDIGILVLELFLEGLSLLITSIPVPEFLSNGLGSYLNNVDPAILYFLGKSGLTESFALLAAGLTFRLLRKLFTLGQW